MTAALAFVDTETTGLDPDFHEVWEVALILRSEDGKEREWCWQLPVDLARAEAKALEIGRYYERRKNLDNSPDLPEFSDDFARLTAGAHLVGAVPSFDDAFLKRLLRRNGACPGWHYHLIDVEALAIGYLRQSCEDVPGELADRIRDLTSPPWNSSDLTAALGLDIDDSTKHTALGDARWAKAIYDSVML